MTSPDYGLLPRDKTFARLLPAYALPYFAYVALAAVPEAELRAALQLVVVGALLLAFRRQYRFGPGLTKQALPWIIGGAVFALALWILSLRLCLELPWWRARAAAGALEFSPLYLALRGFNSALLVPVFEEQLCRVYIPEFLAAGWDALGRLPKALGAPPVHFTALAGAAVFFASGHPGPALVPAALYFLFTSWVYARTRSFRAVVAIHALVNLAIAALAGLRPELRFLWS